MLTLNDLAYAIKLYNFDADLTLIGKSYVYAKKLHGGQKRKSGEPYFNHILEVTRILIKLQLDDITICAGLLHDTIEDTIASEDDIRKVFGHIIGNLVDGVTKISGVKFNSFIEQQAANWKKMLNAALKDIRVLFVKLADRLHNMRTLEVMSYKKQIRIAQETMDFYVPLANRLGINCIKVELEELSFQYLYNDAYIKLKENINQTKKDQTLFINTVSKHLYQLLVQYDVKNFKILGRLKTLWSIYSKIYNKKFSFNRICDFIAFRILVSSSVQCYEVLGYIHCLLEPLPRKFKDYVRMEKNNAYQSLHTTVLNAKGDTIEIQIKSHDMHRIAESGIAAHWKYKFVYNPDVFYNDFKSIFVWLYKLINVEYAIHDSKKFLESIKMNLFIKSYYIYTPTGRKIELPDHATPIDFAFAIHSNLGTHCYKAIVNYEFVPLSYQLQHEDICHIITKKKQFPKDEWLLFAVTTPAKIIIENCLKYKSRYMNRKLGIEILSDILMHQSLNLENIYQLIDVGYVWGRYNFLTIDDLFMALGASEVSNYLSMYILLYYYFIYNIYIFIEDYKYNQIITRISKIFFSSLLLKHKEYVIVITAPCCMPIHGDLIIGDYINQYNILIHKYNCYQIFKCKYNKFLYIYWYQNIILMNIIFIKVFAYNKSHIFAYASSILIEYQAKILSTKSKLVKKKYIIIIFKCIVMESIQVNQILISIKNIQGVYSAHRCT